VQVCFTRKIYHAKTFQFCYVLAGGFGRRASDGGANLHIFYPSSNPTQIPNEDLYSRQNSHEFMMMTEQGPSSGCQLKGDANMESSEDSNDEIQRYMHGRGCSKRHTVGCTDDLSKNPNGQCMDPPLAHSPIPSTSGMSQSGTSGRTRRTGLLTVMERPPGRLSIKLFSLQYFCFRFFSFLHGFFFFCKIIFAFYFFPFYFAIIFCCCFFKNYFSLNQNL
jgi:hypothetical protein